MRTFYLLLQTLPVSRLIVLLIAYTFVIAGSFWLAFLIRFDFVVPDRFVADIPGYLLWILPLKLALLYLFRQFHGVLSYFSLPDLQRLFAAMGIAAVVIAGGHWLAGVELSPPRGVILADFVIGFTLLASLRLGFRVYRERRRNRTAGERRRTRRAGIIGAGDVGAALVNDLHGRNGLGLKPVCFFDDDKSKWRSRVHGIQVVGPPELLIDSTTRYGLDEIIIAMPSATARRIGEIAKLLQKTGLKHRIVPAMDQLATGQVRVSKLRQVEIQDLLGREPVELEEDRIGEVLRNRVIMVTGGGGSIGSELCRQIASFAPRRLILVDQSEVQLFPIEQELIGDGHGSVVLPIVADVLDRPRMDAIFGRLRPEIVFHAAAHKHVPLMEAQPTEALRNNSFGTVVLAELALKYEADRFILVSTDKAINPTSVMGASKRLAEVFIQSLGATQPGGTRFMAVRFGNVLGSSGSVVPIFNRQIAEGGPVKVTHPEITRYFMTIPEAVGLILQCGTGGEGGEIFVLDMGEPIRIVDLAHQMIELSGLRPGEDIEIEFTGLRPGEKLFEELSYQGEHLAETEHPKIMRLVCVPRPLPEVRLMLERMENHLYEPDANQVKELLREAVPEYAPYVS